MSDSNGTSNSDTGLERKSSTKGFLLKSSMLRPSAFGGSTVDEQEVDRQSENNDCNNVQQQSNSIPNNNAKVWNPFSNMQDNEDEGIGTESSKNSSSSTNNSVNNGPGLLPSNGLPKISLFSTAQTTTSFGSNFVFGQNVREKVIGLDKDSANSESETEVNNTKATEESDTNTTSGEQMFAKIASTSTVVEPKEPVSKSLTEVAREYEESRVQKRKYEEVETFTGEEDEINIIDVTGKLFAFGSSTWEERGRGNLRLNDSKDGSLGSRVVFRTSGNLRVLLNTKIWAEMVAEMPSPKSLRLTAMDTTGTVKIFLMMARPDEINNLYRCLRQRINNEKQKQVILDNELNASLSDDPSDERDGKRPKIEINCVPADDMNSTESDNKVNTDTV